MSSPAEADPPVPDPNPQPTVPGYDILGVVAQSGMSTIYRVRDLNLDQEMAMKVLQSWVKRERLLFEAQVTARLEHPAIMPVYRIGQLSDGRLFLLMPLISGRTLATLLRDRGDRSEHLSRLLYVLEQVGQAVEYAHTEGVIHRNIKPSKVLINSHGRVLLLGWGLSRVTASHTALAGSCEGVVGTAAFMPPEQARGEVADARSDVFGLGGLLCAILTGEPTFTGGNVRDLLQRAAAGDVAEAFARLDSCGANPELIALAKRCLAPNPADRPASAAEVAEVVAAHRPPFGPQPEIVPTPPHREEPSSAAVSEPQVAEQLQRGRGRFLLFLLVAVVLLLLFEVMLFSQP